MAILKGSSGSGSNQQAQPVNAFDLDALLSGTVRAPEITTEVATPIEEVAENVTETPFIDRAGLADISGVDNFEQSALQDEAIQQQAATAVPANTFDNSGQRPSLGATLEQAGEQYLNTPATGDRVAGEVPTRKRMNIDQDGVDIVNKMAEDFQTNMVQQKPEAIDVLRNVAEGLQAAGLDPRTAPASLSGSLAIARAAVYNNVAKYKYLEQATEVQDEDSTADPVLNLAPNKDVFEALNRGDNANPALTGLVNDFATKLQYQAELNAGIQEGTIDPQNQEQLWALRNNLNPQAAPAFKRAATRDLINDVEKGNLTFGRDIKGNLVPTISKNETNVDVFFNDDDMGAARTGLDNSLLGIFPEDAPSFRSGIRAQSTPFGNNNPNSKIAKDKAGAKAYKGETGATNKSALNILSNTAIGFSKDLTNIAKAMYAAGKPTGQGKDLAVSTSPFAETMAKMSEDDLNKYGITKGDKGARQEIAKQDAQVQRHLNDYIANGIGRPLYQTFHNSEATTRFFPDSVDMNYVNHKGTIRPVMNFQSIPLVESKDINGMFRTVSDTDRLLNNAKKIYQPRSNAVARGRAVDKALKALPRTELLALNYRYNLGVQMAKHVSSANMKASLAEEFGKPISQWTEIDFIDYGSRPSTQDKAAELGRQLIDATTPPTPDGVAGPEKLTALVGTDDFKGWLNKRGEWGNTASALIDAHNIHTSNGRPVKLENKMEADARQSNAAIMSAILGDTDTAQLLGLLDQGANPSVAKFDSLRDKIGKDMTVAVAETFTGGSEREFQTKALWTNLTNIYKETANSDKGYARGIVVAGLYGKSSLRMYTEGVDFLNAVQATANDPQNKNPELREALNELNKHYSLRTQGNSAQFNNKKLLDDVTDLFTTSAKRNMKKLSGFQDTMKSIGSLKAASNGSTQITSISGNKQQVVPQTFGPVYAEHNDQAGISKVMEDIGSGYQIPSTTSVTAAGAGKGARVYDNYNKETGELATGAERITVGKDIAGSKLRDAFAVDLIQGLDSALMAMTIVNSNFNPTTGKATDVPYSIMPIHDAIISGPDGHLIAQNAYNNIAIPQMVENTPGYYQGILDQAYQEVEAAKQLHKDGGNIGRAFYGKGAQQTSPGISGHFDRIYDYAYGDKTVDPGDLQELTQAEAKQFWSEAQKGRKNREARIRIQKAASDVYLRTAYELGWRPDNAAFIDKKDHNRVSGENYGKLLDLIAINEKIVESESAVVPQELKDAMVEVSKATGVPLSTLKREILEPRNRKTRKVSGQKDNHAAFMDNFGKTGNIRSLVPE